MLTTTRSNETAARHCGPDVQLVAFNAPHGALDRIECSVKPAVGKMNHHAIDAQRPSTMQNGWSGEIAEAGAFDKLVKGAALVSGHEIEGDERLVAQLVSRAMRLRQPRPCVATTSGCLP